VDTAGSVVEDRLTPQGGAPPGGIHIPTWTAWTPDDADLRLIEDGFEDVAWAFGGTPSVREIVFFEMAYELTAAGAVPTTGACGVPARGSAVWASR